jgi:K+-sensing histidine kinase KdpD
MNTGTTAAKEAGNMVDLDSDPAKLMDVVEIGKQLLITRGALTAFSIANDVAKYFAIIPVSHDLRTPLASIKASSSTLADLVQNLLDMSRIQAGVLQPRRQVASLADLVSSVVSDLAPAACGYAVQAELPGNLPPVDVDPTLISRVLTNLLENVIRHGPRHRTITVGGALAAPNALKVHVADHGPGVRPERRSEIFELFARRTSRSRLCQRTALPEGLRLPDQAHARRRAGKLPAK